MISLILGGSKTLFKKEVIEMANEKLAVITTGGTAEPIDDVRYVTNFSTGKFGHEIAKALADLGYRVESLTAKASMWLGDYPGVTKIPFTSAESLKTELVQRENPAIIMMAAAVSDYAPVPTDGKISSNKDELIIIMERTPKILAGLRHAFGRDTFIVGFKLLSGVSRGELIRVAQKQLRDNRLNLVVANDLRQLKNGMHPLIVITPEGGAIDFAGTREDVARQLAEFVHKRSSAKHFHSVAESIEEKEPLDDAGILYEGVLKMAQKLNLLTDTSGHVSAWRPEDDSMWVSPRQVDKSTMTSDDAVLAKVRGSDILFAGTQKPSTDTAILGVLYAHPLTTIPAFLHFHGGWGRMKCQTEFPYPCGTWEEYCEIYKAAEAVKLFSDWNDERSIELVHHGFLLGINGHEQLNELKQTWRTVHSEFIAHAKEVSEKTGKTPVFDRKKFRPVWDGTQIVGLIYDDPSAATVYLTPAARGKGIGKIVVGQLKARGYTIRTLEYCDVADYYEKEGFTAYEGEDGLMRLAPPKLKAGEI